MDSTHKVLPAKELLLLIAILGVLYALRRTHFWWWHGRRMVQVPGHLPPPPSWAARRAKEAICNLLNFVGVGPLHVIGDKNPDTSGRLIVCANHQDEWDFSVIEALLPLGYRTLAAINQIFGIRVPLAAWTGTLVVHYLTKEAKQAVVETAVRVFSLHDAKIMIFPQGQMIRDNVLRPEEFRTGTVRIIFGTAEATGEEAGSILPLGIVFLRDKKHMSRLHRQVYGLGYAIFKLTRRCRKIKPYRAGTTWIRLKVPCFGVKIYRLCRRFRNLFGHTNCGAVIAVGKPISGKDLPKDVREATEHVRRQIQILVDRAHKYAAGLAVKEQKQQICTSTGY